MSDALKYITTCRLCNQRFSNSALPIIGDQPDRQTAKFVTGSHPAIRLRPCS